MVRKLILRCTCVAVVLMLSRYAFAAGSNGAVEVSKLEMTVKSFTMKKGQSRTVNVAVLPGKADDKSIIWTSSDVTVATVSPTAVSGRATIKSVGEGKAKITATSHNGKTAVCSITVSDDEVEVRRIEMVAETATIRVNQIKTLPVQFFPANADDQTVIWDSGNRDVAAVGEDGTVIGISPGIAEITAMSSNGKTAVCTVTVTLPALTAAEQRAAEADSEALTGYAGAGVNTSIRDNISMTAGEKKDLSGHIKYKEIYRDGDGNRQTEWQLSGTVTWASSFPEVVSVNDKGVATAHRTGTSRITATGRDETGQKRVQSIIVGVTSKSGASAENSFEISEGVKLDLRQIGELHSGTKTIQWTSSVPDIASVDSSGLVSAQSIGQCTVTASYTDENNASRAVRYQVRVTAASLGNKTKNSVIVLKAGNRIDLGRMYYSGYQDLPDVLNRYYCATGTKNVLSADRLSVLAKAAGTASASIIKADGTDESICHRITVVVKK